MKRRLNPSPYQSYERGRYARTKAVLEAADKAAKLHEQPRLVPKYFLIPMIEKISASLPDDDRTLERVSRLTNVPVRRLWEIVNRPEGNPTRRKNGMINHSPNVSFTTAERIAMVAGCEEELLETLGEPGIEDWNKNGDRYCRRCGSWQHPHFAKGLCRRCYRSHRYAESVGRLPPLPKTERWAIRHNYCRECSTRDRKHTARGLCTACYERWAKIAVEKNVKLAELLDDIHPMDYPEAQALHHKSSRRRKQLR